MSRHGLSYPERKSSWYEHWNKIAKRVHALADSALQRGKRVSARRPISALNLYEPRSSFSTAIRTISRILATWGTSRTTFCQAVKLMDIPVEQVLIPYEGTRLPGYYYRPEQLPPATSYPDCAWRVQLTGEELYFLITAATIQRGYNCLTFEGPGQGASSANSICRCARIGSRW